VISKQQIKNKENYQSKVFSVVEALIFKAIVEKNNKTIFEQF